MEVLGPTRLTEVQEAQKVRINVARTMSDEGTIVLEEVEMTLYDTSSRESKKSDQDKKNSALNTEEIFEFIE